MDISRAAVHTAKYVVAQVNPQMPRTHGEGFIHVGQLLAMVWVNEPLPQIAPQPLTPALKAIGQYCATLVEDGATLQMGIGAMPDAVLAMLTNHKRLGVHTVRNVFRAASVNSPLKGVLGVLEEEFASSRILGIRVHRWWICHSSR